MRSNENRVVNAKVLTIASPAGKDIPVSGELCWLIAGEQTLDNRGYIYVLANSSMPDLVKVGKTTRTPSHRAQELSGVTGIPTPFIVVYQQLFEDCSVAEDYLHTILKQKGYRETDNREFFRAPINEIIHIIAKMDGKISNSDNSYNETSNDELITTHPHDKLEDLLLDGSPEAHPWSGIMQEADCYYFGRHDYLQDYREAMKLYLEAVKLGCSEVYERLGLMYRCGLGVPASKQKALDYYKEGARKGNYHCYIEMGDLYYADIYLNETSINSLNNYFKCMRLYFKSRKERINPEIEELHEFHDICTDYIQNCLDNDRHPPQEIIEQMAIVKDDIIKWMNEMVVHNKNHYGDLKVQERYLRVIKWANDHLIKESNFNELLGQLNQVACDANKLGSEMNRCIAYILNCLDNDRHPPQEIIEQMAIVKNDIIKRMNEMVVYDKNHNNNLKIQERYLSVIKWANDHLIKESNSNELLGQLNQVACDANKLGSEKKGESSFQRIITAVKRLSQKIINSGSK